MAETRIGEIQRRLGEIARERSEKGWLDVDALRREDSYFHDAFVAAPISMVPWSAVEGWSDAIPHVKFWLAFEKRLKSRYVDEKNPTPFDLDNRAHVDRLLGYASKISEQTGLTVWELNNLRMAILYSDYGKRMAYVRTEFREELGDMGDVQKALPHLDGVVHWLRRYQEQTGEPLQLKDFSSGDSAAAKKLGALQRQWGAEPFEMSGRSDEPPSIADRIAARRFVNIVFTNIFDAEPGKEMAEFFPVGLYWHEIPGYAAAYAEKAPPEVLSAIFGHNGPERAMDMVGGLGGGVYRDVTTDS